MTKRIVPYGYAIENGRYTLEAEEAAVVQQIYSLYLTGESYARIADSLNHSGPAYHPEHPLWNKHIVKRILEKANTPVSRTIRRSSIRYNSAPSKR